MEEQWYCTLNLLGIRRFGSGVNWHPGFADIALNLCGYDGCA